MSSERQLQVGAGTVPVQSRGGCELSYLSAPSHIPTAHRAGDHPLSQGCPQDRQAGRVVTTQRVLSIPGANRRMETGGGGDNLEHSSQMGTAVARSQRAQLRKVLPLQAARIYSSA